jgi:hypothetical protein
MHSSAPSFALCDSKLLDTVRILLFRIHRHFVTAFSIPYHRPAIEQALFKAAAEHWQESVQKEAKNTADYLVRVCEAAVDCKISIQ